MSSPIRWGIVGTGDICRDFTAALMMMPEVEHKVCAVAARSVEKAMTFNTSFDHTIPNVYGSYQEMAEDPTLDVIYIGTIHPSHYPLAMMMMEAGKNVLVEKPMAMNARMVKELVDKAREKEVFLMEGFWSRFFPIYAHLREAISSSSIGNVHTVVANFGFGMSPEWQKERFIQLDLGAGALLDVGCYPVQLATLVFGERPERICASGQLSEDGYDLNSSTTLYYPGGRRAVLNCCMDNLYDQTATIMGTEGFIRIPNFWNPEQMITPTTTHTCPVPKGQMKMTHDRGEGLTYEISAVRECLLRGQKECPLMTHEHSIIINEILDEIRRQIGVAYKEDW